ncbi:hypothetical protein PV797_15135 [Clostridiaceae bacterium M8S5]|nr:hypothetical protein PV797_15135 [Clostridiaceae bacterium M8S5]
MQANFIIDRLKDKVCIYFENDIDNLLDKFKNILVIPFYNSSLVMTYHPKKKVWDFPKTEMITDEDINACVARSGFNEIGATFNTVQPFAYYEIIAEDTKVTTGVVVGQIDKFEPKPRWSETDIVKLFNELPDNVKENDKLIYEMLIKEALDNPNILLEG